MSKINWAELQKEFFIQQVVTDRAKVNGGIVRSGDKKFIMIDSIPIQVKLVFGDLGEHQHITKLLEKNAALVKDRIILIRYEKPFDVFDMNGKFGLYVETGEILKPVAGTDAKI